MRHGLIGSAKRSSGAGWLIRERHGREAVENGLSIQSSNHYLAAIKSFANWLVKDRRIAANPLAHLTKLNVKLDSHLGLIDMTAGLAALPTITAPAFQECRATGTTDDLADSGCTNGCTRSGATNRFQPFSTVSGFDDDANAPPTTKPRFSAENEALCGESRASNVVPPTGAELPQDLAGNSKVREWDDAHSDALAVLNQVDDARLVALIEQWPVLSDRVKDEILKLAEHDKATKLPRECVAE